MSDPLSLLLLKAMVFREALCISPPGGDCGLCLWRVSLSDMFCFPLRGVSLRDSLSGTYLWLFLHLYNVLWLNSRGK